MIEANRRVRESGVHNYKKCKIQVPSNFNFKFLEKHLSHYTEFPQLLDCLKYGFPLDIKPGFGSKKIPRNHKGARDFPDEMTRILNKEIATKSAIGPFEASPFIDARFSALNSVPKKDSSDRRLILDLSLPEKLAINDGIDKDRYLTCDEKLKLPSVDALAERVAHIGKGALMFKVDLTRGYRQIKVDPGDIHLLGYVYRNKFYFDVSLAMGGRSSARCCQIVTTAVVYVYTKMGYFAINYLDDLGGAEEPEHAETAFNNLRTLLENFGLQEAVEKACPPTTCMVFLGVEVNSIEMTLSIPEQKWLEICKVLTMWKGKQTASLKEVQELAGLLNFACRCIRPGRIYLARILNFLRDLHKREQKEVPRAVRSDIDWWLDMARDFNRVSLILQNETPETDKYMASDSCLTGGGGYMQGCYLQWAYPQKLLDLGCDINQLECLMVVLCVLKWGKSCARKRIKIHCDNRNSVLAINTGKSRDKRIQSCLRQLHKLCILFSCEVSAEFLSGVDNRIPDFLSRFHLHEKFRKAFYKEVTGVQLTKFTIKEKDWEFFIQDDL